MLFLDSANRVIDTSDNTAQDVTEAQLREILNLGIPVHGVRIVGNTLQRYSWREQYAQKAQALGVTKLTYTDRDKLDCQIVTSQPINLLEYTEVMPKFLTLRGTAVCSRYLKFNGKVRLVTNGHGSLDVSDLTDEQVTSFYSEIAGTNANETGKFLSLQDRARVKGSKRELDFYTYVLSSNIDRLWDYNYSDCHVSDFEPVVFKKLEPYMFRSILNLDARSLSVFSAFKRLPKYTPYKLTRQDNYIYLKNLWKAVEHRHNCFYSLAIYINNFGITGNIKRYVDHIVGLI